MPIGNMGWLPRIASISEVEVPQDCILGHSQSSLRDWFVSRICPQDYPGFPVRCSRWICVCGFLYGKPHEAPWFHQPAQEIRVRPGLLSAVPTGLNSERVVLTQTLKPVVFSIVYGPTKVVP